VAQPMQRISSHDDAHTRTADRALLLERVAVGLAHEGKNPLHNMMLHLQLMAEKLNTAGLPVAKHLTALRDGIGKVDGLLKSFGEFAAPEHLPTDLAAAGRRAALLFAYDARRASVIISVVAPESLTVRSDSRWLGDLVAHALVAGIECARDGGQVTLEVLPQGAAATLTVRAQGGGGGREHANAHFDAARRLAADAACDLSIEIPPGGVARLSLHFLHPR
jgi:C4-dicarboxylate-specific signal transduction histidine kinase